MKRFKIIKNILIIFVVIVSILYIFYIRNNNISTSKTYNLFNKLYQIKDCQVTMQLNYESNDLYSHLIFASDYIAQKEVQFMDTYLKNDQQNRSISIITTTNEGASTIVLFPEVNSYKKMEIDTSKKTNNYDEWYTRYLNRICEKYYTKGYKLIENKLLYYENFPSSGLTFYFDKNELIYIKDKNLNESYNLDDNCLYNVKLTYTDSYNNYITIPNEYIEI